MTDIIDIGPECFANGEATIISYKGENYYKTCDALVIEGLGSRSYCVKRCGHGGDIHEDFDGMTREFTPVLDKPTNRFAECTDIEQLLTQVVGASSVCWESLDHAGVFLDGQAIEIVKDAIEKLDSFQPTLGYATNAQLLTELNTRLTVGHTAPDYRTVDGDNEISARCEDLPAHQQLKSFTEMQELLADHSHGSVVEQVQRMFETRDSQLGGQVSTWTLAEECIKFVLSRA